MEKSLVRFLNHKRISSSVQNLLELYGVEIIDDIFALDLERVTKIEHAVQNGEFSNRVDFTSKENRLKYLGFDFKDITTYTFKPLEKEKLLSIKSSEIFLTKKFSTSQADQIAEQNASSADPETSHAQEENTENSCSTDNDEEPPVKKSKKSSPDLDTKGATLTDGVSIKKKSGKQVEIDKFFKVADNSEVLSEDDEINNQSEDPAKEFSSDRKFFLNVPYSHFRRLKMETIDISVQPITDFFMNANVTKD